HLGPTAAVMNAVTDERSAEAWAQGRRRLRERHSSAGSVIDSSGAAKNRVSCGSGHRREQVVRSVNVTTPSEAPRCASSADAEAGIAGGWRGGRPVVGEGGRTAGLHRGW